MERYQVILAYDGTEFFGMQRQADARTVQGVFEQALRELGWQGSSILAAGRTDAGVHASGQVVAFDMDWPHSELDLLQALNANLPPDAAARGLVKVSEDFHPRFDAVSRCYRYHIYCRPQRDPLQDRFAWRVWPQPELPLLQQAAEKLIGTHDFSAFGSPPEQGGPTLRNVSESRWEGVGSRLEFSIEANAFLYHMVRRLVGFQVEIGQGKHNIEELALLLELPGERMVQGLAPAKGLELIRVLYQV